MTPSTMPTAKRPDIGLFPACFDALTVTIAITVATPIIMPSIRESPAGPVAPKLRHLALRDHPFKGQRAKLST
jgi:hypothetical protein